MSTSIAVNSGAGTGGSATLDSGANDARGRINLSMGTSAPLNTSIATVTFDTSYSTVPYVNLQREDLSSPLNPDVVVINETVNGFDIAFATNGNLSGLTGLKFNYLVTE